MTFPTVINTSTPLVGHIIGKKLDILKETQEIAMNCKIEYYTANKLTFSGKNIP